MAVEEQRSVVVEAVEQLGSLGEEVVVAVGVVEVAAGALQTSSCLAEAVLVVDALADGLEMDIEVLLRERLNSWVTAVCG